MIPVEMWPATVGGYDDGAIGLRSAVLDAVPEIVGHGETDDDAVEDLCHQLQAIVWH